MNRNEFDAVARRPRMLTRDDVLEAAGCGCVCGVLALLALGAAILLLYATGYL
jgi:hypothetical protein